MSAQSLQNYNRKGTGGRARQRTIVRDEYAFLVAAKRGDSAAFEVLCKQHASTVFHIARRMMRSKEDAEDVMQESFQSAFIHLKSFKSGSRSSTWLSRIAINAALMIPIHPIHILPSASVIAQTTVPSNGFSAASRNLGAAPVLLATDTAAQEKPNAPVAQEPDQKSSPIQVNWLYGAYVPRDAILKSLTGSERKRLYLHQTFLTWGIYFKTAMFSLGDQASTSPPQWGDGIGGYGKRFASRYGQFAIQNTLSTAGNSILGYEPRYDRCRCNGAWPRVRHALARNFVTYNSSERERRPQFALYGGALGAGMIASVWKPTQASPWVSGYQSVLTQIVFGSFSNVVGEFAPEIGRILKRNAK